MEQKPIEIIAFTFKNIMQLTLSFINWIVEDNILLQLTTQNSHFVATYFNLFYHGFSLNRTFILLVVDIFN